MTRRERLLTVFNLGIPDRVPIGMDAWIATRKRIYEYYGVKDHYDFYGKTGIDNFALWDWPVIAPAYKGPPRDSIKDHNVIMGAWGAISERVFPILVGLDKYYWHSSKDFDFSCIKAGFLDAHEHDMVSIGSHISCGLNHHIRMRGYEQSMYDVLDDNFMEEYMGRIREYFIGYLSVLFEAAEGSMDIIRCDEDLGGQNTMLVNPKIWRKWYKPLWKELFDIVHNNGTKIWMHSCGYCRDVIEDFIEIGVDVLDPVPPYVTGSDPGEMKKHFGSRLCLHGGINHIDAFVYGTPETVKQEVELRMSQLKPGGGYICGPSQMLTDQMPLENIVAFFETALELGNY